MNRLIAFGCSLTYGQGLPDCYIAPQHPGTSASKLAWPEIVAQQLNRTCVNMSSPGASNKKIWHSIINFKFKKDDIVIILWSYEDRFSILNDKESVEDIGPWIESDSTVAYYRHLYNSYDSLMQAKLYISHANFLLKEKSIPVYNLKATKENLDVFKLSGQHIPHIPLYLCSNYKHKYPKALDHRHPGIECNQIFANDILQYIVSDKYKQPGAL